MTGDQVDGVDELDVDEPIPFRLTTLGLRALEQCRMDDRLGSCAHVWNVSRRGGVMWAECGRCGLDEQVKPRQPIPAYLGKHQ